MEPGPDVLQTDLETEEEVVVGRPVRLGRPAAATSRKRHFTNRGYRDRTRTRRTICASCRGVLHEGNLGAVCAVCEYLLCDRCSQLRCANCGASLCRRHSVPTGGEVLCPGHFRAMAVGALIVFALVGLGLVAIGCLVAFQVSMTIFGLDAEPALAA